MADLVEIEPAYRPLLAAHGLDTLESILSWTDGQRLDKPGLESWRQRWRIELARPGAGCETLYLKRFTAPPFARQWRRWCEGTIAHSTAYVEWRRAGELARLGIPAARAIAFGERMTAGRELASFVILQEVHGDPLERLAGMPPESRPAATRARVDALARLVARFHRAGYVHRDLYLAHIFLLHGRDGGREEDYVLIDLQRVMRPGWNCQRWVVKDLAALAFSAPADWVSPRRRLAFLARYVRVSGAARPDRTGRRRRLQRLAARIARRVNRMNARANRRSASAPARVRQVNAPASAVS